MFMATQKEHKKLGMKMNETIIMITPPISMFWMDWGRTSSNCKKIINYSFLFILLLHCIIYSPKIVEGIDNLRNPSGSTTVFYILAQFESVLSFSLKRFVSSFELYFEDHINFDLLDYSDFYYVSFFSSHYPKRNFFCSDLQSTS